jgi:hypothetical protein
MTESVPEVRVGDRERRAVDDQLRACLSDGVLTLSEYDERALQCYAARTRSELQALVRDLPGAPPLVPAQASAVHSGPRTVTAVLSDDELDVPLLPGQEVQATAVLGTAKVELRREDLPRELHVRATAVLGEVKVRVPPGSTVHLTGGAVMGERKARTGPASADGPVVHVHANAVMGTVTVEDKPRKGGLIPAPRAGSVAVSTVESTGGRGTVARRTAGALVGGAVTLAVVVGGAVAVGTVVTSGDGFALFGSHEVQVTDDQERVEVGVLFGSVKVVVPDELRARTSGVVVFGSTQCRGACSAPGPENVEVRGLGGFGSIEVVSESEDRDD